jgi:hypothetical protein
LQFYFDAVFLGSIRNPDLDLNVSELVTKENIFRRVECLLVKKENAEKSLLTRERKRED